MGYEVLLASVVRYRACAEHRYCNKYEMFIALCRFVLTYNSVSSSALMAIVNCDVVYEDIFKTS